MRALSILLASLACAGSGYGQIGSPRVATVRYADGRAYNLLGLHGSYVVGPPRLTGITAASFSDDLALVSTGAELRLLSGDAAIATYPAADPNLVLHVGDAAESAIAWLPSQSTLVLFQDGKFVRLAVPTLGVDGSVTAIWKSSEGTASMLVAENSGAIAHVSVHLKSGELADVGYLPGAFRAAFELGSRVVGFRDGVLRIADDAGTVLFETKIAASEVLFEQASSHSVHIASSTDNRNWLLYAEKATFGISELPPAGAAR